MVFELYAEPCNARFNEPLSTTELTDSEIPSDCAIDEVQNDDEDKGILPTKLTDSEIPSDCAIDEVQNDDDEQGISFFLGICLLALMLML